VCEDPAQVNPSILVLASLLSGLAPAASEAVDPQSQADPAAYDEATAQTDVHTILDGRGRVYLDARARLEEHPALAAQAVVDRLQAVPAPGPSQRQRLLSVLSALHRPEHVGIFAEQLRGAMLDEKPTDIWKGLLLDQGSAAVPALFELVADRELTMEQRGELLDALLDRLPRERFPEMTAQISSGSSVLQDHLRRGLIRRAKADSADGEAIVAALLEEMSRAEADGGRLAAVVVFLAACGADGEHLVTQLGTLATNESKPFVARAAAVHALGRTDRGAAALEQVARHHATPTARRVQASELLAWLALEAMDPTQARAIATDLELHEAESPRLASLAYGLVELSPDHLWLPASQEHPWPQVRRAALQRVEGECTRKTVQSLARIAGPPPRGGAKDVLVGRAAVSALGRCGDEDALDALADILANRSLESPLRANAARQLIEHDVPGGADLIAKLLARGNFPEISRELAETLAHAPKPTKFVWEALCLSLEGEDPRVVPAARASFRKLYPEGTCAGLYGDEGP
jgi:hypothetical protein